jgi:hypothetical protein
MPTTPTHLDRLGNLLAVDDVVAVADSNTLMIARITKLNPKMIKVTKIGKKAMWRADEQNKYSCDCVKISEADAVMYILKNT